MIRANPAWFNAAIINAVFKTTAPKTFKKNKAWSVGVYSTMLCTICSILYYTRALSNKTKYNFHPQRIYAKKPVMFFPRNLLFNSLKPIHLFSR
jgi:hypothetical protein